MRALLKNAQKCDWAHRVLYNNYFWDIFQNIANIDSNTSGNDMYTNTLCVFYDKIIKIFFDSVTRKAALGSRINV
jgi:hypothetical protein